MSDDAIYIVIDETYPPHPTFIEIENEKGESLDIGERIPAYGSGVTRIKITPEMIKKINDEKNVDELIDED